MSGAASPQPWEQAHAIDLGAVEGPLADRIPEPSPPRRYRYVHNIALAYAAVALALVAAAVTAVKWSPLHRPVAEAAVLSFLEAVRDGDVKEALSHTNQADIADPDPDPGSDEGPAWGATRADFLVPEALDARWEIVTVAQVGFKRGVEEGRAVAQVYAEIEAYDGTRVGHRYRVAVERGKAELEGAIPIAEAWGAFEYLDMNGVRLEMDPDVGFTHVHLLPGLYEFYPGLPPTVGLDDPAGMLVLGDAFLPLGGEVPEEWMPAPWPSVTQEGVNAVEAALREHYDACAADPSREGCPFAFPEDPERELALAPGAAWEVTVYPQVAAEQLWYEYGLGYRLQTAVPGEARVSARIVEDGRERTAMVSCPIWVDGLYARLDAEGGASVGDDGEAAAERCRSVIEVD